MEFFWYEGFELEVVEYESDSIRTEKKRAKKKTISHFPIRFSHFRLSVALAKSILSKNPEDEDLIKEVRAALYSLDSTLKLNCRDFRLAPRFRAKYRDFSKSSRVGELAQAVSFIFSQQILNHPIVIDFGGFLESQGVPPMPEKLQSPDYALLFKGGSTRPCILESKGGSPDHATEAVKAELKEALNQCWTGESYLRACAKPAYGARNSFGTYLKLAEAADSWNSQLVFCDPENEQIDGMHDPVAAARRYYAAFFIIAGSPSIAEQLMNRVLTPEILGDWRTERIRNSEYLVVETLHSSFNLFTPLLSIKKGQRQRHLPKEWLLRRDLIFAIVREESGKLLAIMQEISSNRIDDATEMGLMNFLDGTLCRLPNAAIQEILEAGSSTPDGGQ